MLWVYVVFCVGFCGCVGGECFVLVVVLFCDLVVLCGVVMFV